MCEICQGYNDLLFELKTARTEKSASKYYAWAVSIVQLIAFTENELTKHKLRDFHPEALSEPIIYKV